MKINNLKNSSKLTERQIKLVVSLIIELGLIIK